VKITSGGGYAFEDSVGAWLAAALLGGQAPLDAELGAPVRIDFQVSVDGWRLDDVLVTFRPADAEVRWAASVKSNAQFSSISAPADFVARCWEEIGGRSGSGFEPERDLVGLVSAPLTGTTHSDLQELVRLAREQDPVDLERRVQQPGYISQQRHKLWTSFQPTFDLSRPENSSLTSSPAEVLRRLRPLQADLDFSPSQFEAQAVEWCRQALVDGDQAARLWKQLLTVVSPVRTAGGVLTYARLAQRLTGFELAVLPRYEGDHRVLAEISARNLDGVVESLAGGLHVGRREQLGAVSEAAAADRFLALVGLSGVGKTALARAWARDREVLWLNAEDLPALVAPGAAGALRHPLLEVLSAWPRRAWLIIDGLDRAFAEPALRGAATLIRALRDSSDAPFGALVTVQQQEWPRVSDAFAAANAGVAWKQVPVTGFGDAELDTVYEAFPNLRAVAVRSRLGSVLRNAKVLDVVTRRLESGARLDAGVALADEASFATWFVEHLAARSGPQRISRVRALLAVAEQQADLLQTATALLDVPDASADQLDALHRDGIWVVNDGKVSFATTSTAIGRGTRCYAHVTHNSGRISPRDSRRRYGIAPFDCTPQDCSQTRTPSAGVANLRALTPESRGWCTTCSWRPLFMPATRSRRSSGCGPSSKPTAGAYCVGCYDDSCTRRPCPTRCWSPVSPPPTPTSPPTRRRRSGSRTGRSGCRCSRSCTATPPPRCSMQAKRRPTSPICGCALPSPTGPCAARRRIWRSGTHDT